jgi:serine/threonine-protein kinase
MEAQPGDFPDIPEYQLLEKLGEGGMGTVYRATQLRQLRTVAVKLLHARPGVLPLRAFQRESELMASLSHPGVVTIYDTGVAGGGPYLVMEYVAGPNLRALLHPGRPWRAAPALRVLDGIAAALSYIHSRGILHLDLKPENVLLPGAAEQGHAFPPAPAPKITDFGLALTHTDARALADPDLAQGTVDYCSPEQCQGLPTDVRSDLFALGTLAYEMLTGRLPGRVFVPASERNPALPAAVDEPLRRALARGPEGRYDTVEEFRRRLTHALAACGPAVPGER